MEIRKLKVDSFWMVCLRKLKQTSLACHAAFDILDVPNWADITTGH